jgi:hypothetical protein
MDDSVSLAVLFFGEDCTGAYDLEGPKIVCNL